MKIMAEESKIETEEPIRLIEFDINLIDSAADVMNEGFGCVTRTLHTICDIRINNFDAMYRPI